MTSDHNDSATGALVALLVAQLAPTVREAVVGAVRETVAEATREAIAEAKREASEDRETGAPLLSTADVAQMLNVCEETIRRRVKRGQLVAVTSFGSLRFRREDVARLLEGEVVRS